MLDNFWIDDVVLEGGEEQRREFIYTAVAIPQADVDTYRTTGSAKATARFQFNGIKVTRGVYGKDTKDSSGKDKPEVGKLNGEVKSNLQLYFTQVFPEPTNPELPARIATTDLTKALPKPGTKIQGYCYSTFNYVQELYHCMILHKNVLLARQYNLTEATKCTVFDPSRPRLIQALPFPYEFNRLNRMFAKQFKTTAEAEALGFVPEVITIGDNEIILARATVVLSGTQTDKPHTAKWFVAADNCPANMSVLPTGSTVAVLPEVTTAVYKQYFERDITVNTEIASYSREFNYIALWIHGCFEYLFKANLSEAIDNPAYSMYVVLNATKSGARIAAPVSHFSYSSKTAIFQMAMVPGTNTLAIPTLEYRAQVDTATGKAYDSNATPIVIEGRPRNKTTGQRFAPIGTGAPGMVNPVNPPTVVGLPNLNNLVH